MRKALALMVLVPSLVAAAPKKPAPAPAPVDEKEATARRFYDSGTVLFNRGQFLDAAREFEHAYSEKALPDILYNIGLAYDKGGERMKAVDAYRKYVAGMPNAPDCAIARARADVLEREWKELEAAKAAAARPVEPKRQLPPPLPFVESVTKYTYQTWINVDGQPYTLLGAGARKVYGFKVYAMALYVEDEPARKQFPSLAGKAGGSDHDTLTRGDIAPQWVVFADWGKCAILHFVRNVSGKDTRDAYREALGDAASSRAAADLKRDAEAFLALFDDIKEGENMVIRTSSDGQVIVEMHGQKRMGPKNARLAHDIWDIWLGQKPISNDLKRTLFDRIDTLGR